MRSDMGWLLWWWEFEYFTIGVDLANWGIGFLFCFRSSQSGAAYVGPFYITWGE